MAHAFQMTVTIEDGKEQRSTVSGYIPSTVAAISDITETATKFADLIGQMIGGTIVAVSAVLPCALPSNLGAGSGDADVEEGGLFIYTTAGNFKTRLRIPTLTESRIVSGSRLVDTTDTEVAAFNTFMEDGWTATTTTNTVEPCDSRDDDVDSLDKAYEQFRKSRPFSKG